MRSYNPAVHALFDFLASPVTGPAS
jgi:hypothetical protein